MLQPGLRAPFRVLERVFAPSLLSSQQLRQPQSLLQRTSFPAPSSISVPKTTTSSLPFLPLSFLRYASHASQGAANRHARDPPGKRLGAKKTGGQYVVPGNIIYRQRGTKWWPGENCAMGRDHTIYATEAGYVQYYLDPDHPKRKFIGVCFERDGTLPTPKNAPRRRRLNMIAVPRQPESSETTDSTEPQLRPGYMYREANWEIGRAAEKAGIKVPEFDRKDRWLAWRKRKARAERVAQMKSLKKQKKLK
ncbi:putative 50S ribosomal protein L27 [Thermoascus aurantiacus ATCC 26904]